MSTPAFTSNSHIWSSESNEFISTKHQRFAEILNDYNEHFFLEYIPKRDRVGNAKPFRIVSKMPDKAPHVIREMTDAEMDNPQAILKWLFEGDVTKHRPEDIFRRLEAARIAEAVWTQKQEDDEAEDRQEMLAQVVRGGRDRKNYYRHNGVTYK